jgi:PadR family transcriptional regulator, regulatory protein PadR
MKTASRQLGDFERSILLALVKLGDDAYGVNIRETLEQTMGREISFGAVYTTLDRLLKKGMVSTRLGDPTPERGGRAKKHFRIESKGLQALERAREASEAIWSLLPARGER